MDGHIYAGVPPLYKVAINKDKYIFLKNDVALQRYRVEHNNKIGEVTRLKGLGEMSAEDTEILVDPEQRIIEQVTVDDIEKANKLFDDLMGTQVLPRKEFIKKHSKEATYDS